eukprot:scaffold152_cov163-Amphora_coffeaeformis.AAC.10
MPPMRKKQSKDFIPILVGIIYRTEAKRKPPNSLSSSTPQDEKKVHSTNKPFSKQKIIAARGDNMDSLQRQNLKYYDDENPKNSVAWLHHRVDHLEILQGLLSQRIRDMEQENARELQLYAANMAENLRLKRAIEHWEEHANHRDGRPVTLEKNRGRPLGGLPKPAGLDLSAESEGESEDSSFEDGNDDDVDNDDDDDSICGATPPKPNARKAADVSGKKSGSKKPKADTTTTRRWTPGNTTQYNVYQCPAMGCSKKVHFAKKDNPPLNSQGLVCDQEPWCPKVWSNKIYQMRWHMKEKHPAVPEVNYPPGFAKLRERKGMKPKADPRV